LDKEEMLQLMVDTWDGTFGEILVHYTSQRSKLIAGMKHIPIEKPASIMKNKISRWKIF
jgi:hypothetical protein